MPSDLTCRINTLTEEKKMTSREILVPAFMSREESGEEDGKPVKSLLWRESKVSMFLKQMDLKGERKKSQQWRGFQVPYQIA